MDSTTELYNLIEQYAQEKQLTNTLAALPLVREIMGNIEKIDDVNIQGVTRYRGAYLHCLTVCKLLISLVLPLSPEDEDIVLAAALCHVLVNKISYNEMYVQTLTCRHMNPHICKIISQITDDSDLSIEGQRKFYSRIQADYLTLIVYLADRANLVQQLHNMAIWNANEYIFETRTYIFPICIFAKENYPELIPTINILMEKIRTLVDACAVLLNRYEKREMELTEDILNLQEENSRIRGILKQLKAEKEKEMIS